MHKNRERRETRAEARTAINRHMQKGLPGKEMGGSEILIEACVLSAVSILDPRCLIKVTMKQLSNAVRHLKPHGWKAA